MIAASSCSSFYCFYLTDLGICENNYSLDLGLLHLSCECLVCYCSSPYDRLGTEKSNLHGKLLDSGTGRLETVSVDC